MVGYLGFNRVQDSHQSKKKGNERRNIAYWRAPMNPTEIYDKPGKSAMGMDLVPVYEDELAESAPLEAITNRIERLPTGALL